MLQLSKTKLLMIFGTCLLGLLFALPNVLNQQTIEKMPSFLQKTVNLGLELRGGSHIQLEVDLKSAHKDYLGHIKDEVRNTLRKEQIGYTDLKLIPKDIGSITLTLREKDDFSKAKKSIVKIDSDLTIQDIPDGSITITFKAGALEKRNKQIIEQSIEVVRRRVDESGTKEPNIQRQGEDRIIVQLPGVEDPADVKRMIGKTAKLTFRLVDNDAQTVGSTEDGKPMGVAPQGSEYLITTDHKGRKYFIPVRTEVKLTGDQLVDARITDDPRSGQPAVSIQFDSKGTRAFAEISKNNVNRQFAMVLDDTVISAPVFNEPITGGNAQISGRFTYKEANELSVLLRAGSLPAPLKVVEESTVGPSLGADSIQHGKQGVGIAFVLVSIFMIMCYSLFGAIANIALTFNIILLFAGLSILQATLTLPGIAGIALTIGMAVDANVLIYERIKEELRTGVKVMVAIQAGYKRAMTTILDSNFTTLLGAAVLFEFGSGPIKGFAVTLALGILISLFTALSLTKLIIYLWVRNKKNLTTLPI